MKIKSIRFVYEVKTFYGNRKQVEDETTYVTEDLLRKSFRELKKNWSTTALWINYGNYSEGIIYDTQKDVEDGIVKFIQSSHNTHSTFSEYRDVNKVKSDVINDLRKS